MKTKTTRITRGLPAGPRPRVVISTDDVDSEGDRIMQAGLSFRERLRVTLSHDYRALPVGVVTAIQRLPHRTEAEFAWIENDAGALRARNVYEQGGLDASIGFQIEEKTRNEFGGYDILRARVVEFALTAVPANEQAMALVKSLGRAEPDVLILAEEEMGHVEPTAVRAALRQVVEDAVRAEVSRLPRLAAPADEASVLVLDDEVSDVLRGLTPAEVRAAFRTVLEESISREVHSAINALRGRVD